MADKKKSRYWVFVIYPESAPVDWRDQLQMTGLRFAVSPLHDKDQNADGTEKKPHWHVIAIWEGPTTYAAAKAITDKLNAPGPQALNSVKGYYRYLTHKDNPEKHQYDPAEIQHLGGFDPSDYIEWTKSELERLKRDVIAFIREKDILEYADLIEILEDNDMQDLLTVTMNHTMLFGGYLKSRRHRWRDERGQ